MTLFTRTQKGFEVLLCQINPFLLVNDSESGTLEVVLGRLSNCLQFLTELESHVPNVKKFRKNAQEQDPAKQLYSADIAKKMLEFCDRFDKTYTDLKAKHALLQEKKKKTWKITPQSNACWKPNAKET